MTTDERITVDPATLRELGVNVDAFFELLAHPRRRFVLALLERRAEPVALEELAEELARRELDEPDGEIPDGETRPRLIALYHVHLPRMVDVGVVELDRDCDTVSLVDGYARAVSPAASTETK